MTRVGVRELRQHASRFLDIVKAGGSVEVTERGRLVALLVPPTRAVAARDQLVASGRLTPARTPFMVPGHRHRVGDGQRPSDVLGELRGERLR
jgi:prevent-host-death family protein